MQRPTSDKEVIVSLYGKTLSELSKDITGNQERIQRGAKCDRSLKEYDNSIKDVLPCGIVEFLKIAASSSETGKTEWIDACCGDGVALSEASKICSEGDGFSGKHIALTGIDVRRLKSHIDKDTPACSLRFVNQDISQFNVAAHRPDLVTDMFGLLYADDPISDVEMLYGALKVGGILATTFNENFMLDGRLVRGLYLHKHILGSIDESVSYKLGCGSISSDYRHVYFFKKLEPASKLDLGLTPAGCSVTEFGYTLPEYVETP